MCQEPNPDAHLRYKGVLERYRMMYPALKPVFRQQARLFFGCDLVVVSSCDFVMIFVMILVIVSVMILS